MMTARQTPRPAVSQVTPSMWIKRKIKQMKTMMAVRSENVSEMASAVMTAAEMKAAEVIMSRCPSPRPKVRSTRS